MQHLLSSMIDLGAYSVGELLRVDDRQAVLLLTQRGDVQ